MIVSNAAIARSTTVIVLLIIIVLMGGYSYLVLPRESSPEITIPIIVVAVGYEGVSPSDMESLVTVPIERKLAGVSGIKEIRSTSVEGGSTTVIEFEPDTVIEDALQRVRDKVSQAEGDLPADADDPVITEINTSEFPIMVMSLYGDVPLAVLTKIAEDIEDRMEAIRGVLDVDVVGGVEREIQIEVDPSRVAQYGISFGDLIMVTQLENVNTPGGTMDLGDAKFLMRTPGEFRTPDEIEGLVVKAGPTGTVYLGDVATVTDGFKETETISRLNGRTSVTLTVTKRSGENIIRIAEEVNRVLEEMRGQMPAGVDVVLTWDESEWIRDMVSELENSILSGLILVLIVVFVFMGLSNAIFVALAIPVSMLITFCVLYLAGVTLNMVVLFSLILALGMLVDNGIVIVENIYRHAQSGMDRVQAAKTGTGEVAWPVFSSTLTTIAAFVPLFFWPGIFGKFMVYLPMTICIALVGSLFVGLVVNPALASIFMRVSAPKAAAKKERHPFLRLYADLLRVALRWRLVTITLAVTALVVIVGIFAADPKVVFMPDTEPPQAYVNLKCPEGTNLAASDAYVRQVERALEPFMDSIDSVISSVGSEGAGAGPNLGGGAASTHISRVTLDFPKLGDSDVLPSEIIEQLRARLKDMTGVEIRIEKMDMGPPTGPPVNVEISGDNFEELARLAQEIRYFIQDMPGLVDLRDDYSKGKPEVRVIVDRQQAWRTGLNTQLIGVTVQAAINGRKAADYREGDQEYDVIVRFPKEFREDLSNIENMDLIAMDGRRVPFSAVAQVEQGAGLGSIRRMNRKRTVTVSADVDPAFRAPEVLDRVRERLSGFPLPAGYTVAYTGENEDLEETQGFLSRAFAVAIMLIAVVLVTQFNSVAQPLIILSSVVLSLAGVFLGLMLFNMPFGILMTGIGCISLAGVVVNNAIVLIDFINQLRARGVPLEEAIIEAGTTRFRPVMLTAITTILGLVPMAVGVSFDFRKLEWIVGGDSSQWWGSMAVAVIFGLAFATLLTLVVVPTLYSLTASAVALLSRSSAAGRAESVSGDRVEA